MTVICAAVSNDVAVIGGDAGAFDGNVKYASAEPKVFKVNGWLLGASGSFRVINVLSKLTVGSPEQVREILHKELTGDVGEWAVLLVSSAGIYEIGDDFSILKHKENYCAIGAGGEMATGALAALSLYYYDPVEMVKEALNVTAKHNLYCLAPFKILTAKS